MKINVAQLLKEPVGSVRSYEIDETTEEGIPVKGEVHLLRTNRSILVKGGLGTVVRCECSRCLEEFDYALNMEIEEEFFPTRDVATGLALPPPTEAEAFTIGEDNILDLSEALRQYRIMALFMKPICRQDCAGLCPQCGRNLNCGACSCAPIRPESSFAQLQVLLPRSRQRRRKERG